MAICSPGRKCEWTPMSAGIEVCEIALCRAYIEMAQPASHMLD